MAESDGLKFLKDLLIGIDELQWDQFEQDDRIRRLLLGASLCPGLIVPRQAGGVPTDSWLLTDADDDGSLTLEFYPGPSGESTINAFIDPAGRWVTISEDDAEALTVPNDDTWYTVVVRRSTTIYERGTIDLSSGSANIAGTDTEFTRYSGKTSSGYNRGTRIYIDPADTTMGNAGTYEIDTITDDDTLVLVSPIPGGTETGIPFSVAGDFYAAIPADPRIHQRSVPLLALVARTRNPSNNDLILADVKRNDAGSPKVQIIDRRETNLWRPAPVEQRAAWLAVNLEIVDSATPTAGVLTILPWNGVGMEKASIQRARAKDRLVGVIEDSIAGAIRARLFKTADLQVVGASITVDNAGTASAPCLLYIPPVVQSAITGAVTHRIFYAKAGKLYRRASSDDGQTWTGETLVIDPSVVNATDTASNPSVILLQNGRIILLFDYLDNTIPQHQLRYVTSDDYGSTWSINGNAGITALVASGGRATRKSSMAQGPDGQVWVAYQVGTQGGGAETVGVYRSGVKNSVLAVLVYELPLTTNPTSTKLLDPAIWVSDDGAPVVVYTMWTNAARIDIWQASIVVLPTDYPGSSDYALAGQARMMNVELTPAGEESACVEVFQMPGAGVASIWYRRTWDADSDLGAFYVVPTCAPVGMRRTNF